MPRPSGLCVLDWLALLALCAGGLSWLMVGIFFWNPIAATLGWASTFAEHLVYSLIGLAALYVILRLPVLTRNQR